VPRGYDFDLCDLDEQVGNTEVLGYQNSLDPPGVEGHYVPMAWQPAALSVRPGILGKSSAFATINLSKQGESCGGMLV
jgi:hypothetical protein